MDLVDDCPEWFDRICRVTYSAPDWTVHAAHRSMQAAADPTNTLSGATILEKFRRRTIA